MAKKKAKKTVRRKRASDELPSIIIPIGYNVRLKKRPRSVLWDFEYEEIFRSKKVVSDALLAVKPVIEQLYPKLEVTATADGRTLRVVGAVPLKMASTMLVSEFLPLSQVGHLRIKDFILGGLRMGIAVGARARPPSLPDIPEALPPSP